MNEQKVLLVTGASKGIGLEIVLHGLDKGYRVAATSRNAKKLTEAVAAARPGKTGQFLAVEMSFDEESVGGMVRQVTERFGRIDVLVNNAGYAVLGALEEFSPAEVRTNFDVNVFGVLMVMQAVLPCMRRQGSGHIINMASISGTVTGPGQSVYSATKAAVIMLSEALAEETRDFGIQVTAICPGGVRTDFLDASSMRRPAKQIPEYEVVYETMDALNRLNHNQSGDPALVAEAILAVADMEHAPARLYLNEGAVAALRAKLSQVKAESDRMLSLSLSTDQL